MDIYKVVAKSISAFVKTKKKKPVTTQFSKNKNWLNELYTFSY